MSTYLPKANIILTTVCTSGVFGLIYYWFIKTRPDKNDTRINESIIITNEQIEFTKPKKNELQMTKSVSFNLNSKEESKIEKVDNINFITIDNEDSKIMAKKSQHVYRKINNHIETENIINEIVPNKKEKGPRLNEGKAESKIIPDITSDSFRQQINNCTKPCKNGYDSPKLTNKFPEIILKKKNENTHYENVQYGQFIQDMEVEDKTKDDNRVIQNISNNLIDTNTNIMFESDGVDNESVENKENLTVSDRKCPKDKEDSDQIASKLVFENDKIVINNSFELEEILMGKLKFKEYNCTLKLIEKDIQDKELSIIKDKEILIVLEYLYAELHPGLIELSDNFIQERRRYFMTDHETYINILNYFLRKKEEFFLCVLSDLMSKLNISQKVLDNTFFYYMNIADSNSKEVKMIRESYDKVYHAGLKYAIVPKNLTKNKLHKVLKYQCETYEKLINKYPSYEIDIIEIMVTDHVYLEYGLDREAIKAALKKYSIFEDEEFAKVKEKLENFQNDSFINI